MRRFRPRLTYANVVASIALFGVVAGGSAWAHGKIGSKQLKSNAVAAKHIKSNAVRTPKIANNAVKRNKLAEGVLDGIQGPAGPQGPQGPQGPPGEATGLWAVVASDGELVRGSGAVAAEELPLSPGHYSVRFDRNVEGCAHIASVGHPGSDPMVTGSGEIATGMAPTSLPTPCGFGRGPATAPPAATGGATSTCWWSAEQGTGPEGMRSAAFAGGRPASTRPACSTGVKGPS